MLKWAWAPADGVALAVQASPSAMFVDEALADQAIERWLKDENAQEIWLSSVLGEAFEQRLQLHCNASACVLKVIQANRHPLLHTAYLQAGRLGKDRWAAMLAVVAQLQAAELNSPNAVKAALVVSLGTATTIDAVVHSSLAPMQTPAPWLHLGGFIIPGIHTMLNSLHANTAQLPHAQLAFQAWPDNTESAIGSGVGLTQVAVIQRCVADLQASHATPTALFLTGGHAEALASLGLPEAITLPHAVLRGVQIAFSGAASS